MMERKGQYTVRPVKQTEILRKVGGADSNAASKQLAKDRIKRRFLKTFG